MHELIRKLVERRNKAWNEAQAMLDEVEKRGDDFSAEEKEKWERFNAEMDECDARLKELNEVVERNEDFEAQRARLDEIVRPKEERKDADVDDLTRWARGEIRSFAIDLSAAKGEARDLTKGTAAAGGNTVPTSFRASLYEHLIETSAMRQTNATVLTTTSGEDLQVPKTAGYSTAAIVAEAAAIGESDPSFGQETLKAFKYGLTMQISSELLQDTAVEIASFLARQAGRAIGNATGAHYVNGTGTGQPQGFVTAATVGKTGATGKAGVAQYDDYVDLMHSVLSPYRRSGTWVLSDLGLAEARKLKDSNGNPIWQPGMVGNEPNAILGRPYVTDPDVADPALSAKSVHFGDFSTYYIRDVASVRFDRSDDFAFANDLVTYRVLFRTDGRQIDTTGAIKSFAGAAT